MRALRGRLALEAFVCRPCSRAALLLRIAPAETFAYQDPASQTSSTNVPTTPIVDKRQPAQAAFASPTSSLLVQPTISVLELKYAGLAYVFLAISPAVLRANLVALVTRVPPVYAFRMRIPLAQHLRIVARGRSAKQIYVFRTSSALARMIQDVEPDKSAPMEYACPAFSRHAPLILRVMMTRFVGLACACRDPLPAVIGKLLASQGKRVRRVFAWILSSLSARTAQRAKAGIPVPRGFAFPTSLPPAAKEAHVPPKRRVRADFVSPVVFQAVRRTHSA